MLTASLLDGVNTYPYYCNASSILADVTMSNNTSHVTASLTDGSDVGAATTVENLTTQ